MVCSAVFIMDLKGKILISRNYRGDIPMSVSEKFTKHLYGTTKQSNATTPLRRGSAAAGLRGLQPCVPCDVLTQFASLCFAGLIRCMCSMEDDENQLTPCITDEGYTFLYVKHNNLYCQIQHIHTHSFHGRNENGALTFGSSSCIRFLSLFCAFSSLPSAAA